MVTQQAAAALTTDDSQAVKQASFVKAVAACLCEHFRCVIPSSHKYLKSSVFSST